MCMVDPVLYQVMRRVATSGEPFIGTDRWHRPSTCPRTVVEPGRQICSEIAVFREWLRTGSKINVSLALIGFSPSNTCIKSNWRRNARQR